MNTLIIAWLLLALSIVFEVFGMLSLKYSNGFTNPLPTCGAILFFIISMWLMAISLKKIDISISYAVFASCSTTIIAIIGSLMYQESITQVKIIGLFLVVIGVIFINLNA